MAKNRLFNQISPYLLQHAENPVHWQPWGPEALAEAKARNKPILLSIGYAACHWCHVMAHESFENQAIAAQMNKLFVNIKVDREERPDLDTIYQHSLQLIGQRGGWPLTMFLTPVGEPFWGGTYFPPATKHGQAGFPDVLNTIHSYWVREPEAVNQNVLTLKTSLSQMAISKPGEEISLDLIERAAQRLAQEYDATNGGIGTSSKFLNPTILELLWRTHKRSRHPNLKKIVELTLTKMCKGGIYDHLGGGFSRYSTDATWLVPHFEKMLYDNAQLLQILTWAWQETADPLFEIRVQETVAWILREMVTEGGGFAATIDADSDGEEGQFYVWSHNEITRILKEKSTLFIEAYDVKPAGNWQGKTILNQTNAKRRFSPQEEKSLTLCRNRLMKARDERIKPTRDDKVLADWNGLMIIALANAGAAFDKDDWVKAAERAFNFINQSMAKDRKLHHTYRNGKVRHAATLDDYATMISAGIALFEVTGESQYLSTVKNWVKFVNAHFWDNGQGGYFFTADDIEALIVRTKSASDTATPAGNSVMINALARLYYLTGNTTYRDRAEKIIIAFSGEITKNFFPYAALMNAAELLQNGIQIAIIGHREEPNCRSLLRAIYKLGKLNNIISVIEPNHSLPTNHPAFGKRQSKGYATAYVCFKKTCSLAITKPKALSSYLKNIV